VAGWLAELRDRSWLAQSAALGGTLLGVYAFASPIVGLLQGRAGLLAAAVAASLCVLGAVLGLALSRLFRSPKHRGLGFLVGMLPRMGVPLGGAAALQLTGGSLAEGGVLFYLLMFYPMSLAMETWLLLPLGKRLGGAAPVSDNPRP